MTQIDIEITKDLLIRARKIALRNGKWYKLHPMERAVLLLSSKILTRIKSQVLKEIIIKILEKISRSLLLKWKILQIGLELAKKRVEQAIKLGNYKARDWLRDFAYIWYLGWSYLHTSPIYR